MSDTTIETASLPALADEHLERAREARSARSATTLHGGAGHALRQTLMALLEGHGLTAHDSPGEATLQVLRGQVRLTTDEGDWEGAEGDLVTIPPVRHGLLALADSVVLLTVLSPQQ